MIYSLKVLFNNQEGLFNGLEVWLNDKVALFHAFKTMFNCLEGLFNAFEIWSINLEKSFDACNFGLVEDILS